MPAPAYERTQTGRLHVVFLTLAVAFGVGAVWPGADGTLRAVCVMLALTFGFVAACFTSLTVRDEGDHLAVRFGPLPLFATRIAYKDVTSVARARSSWIDGWGIHWVPGRGWTWNLWGFGCVRIVRGGRTLQLGTDDPEGLEAFLRERTAARDPR